MISLFTQLNLSKSIYIYIYMAIVFNIFIFGSSPNLVAADCSNCSNSWTTDISSTFSYGNCVFNIDFSYRDCDTTKELRVNSIQTLTSECDTTNKTTIYKYSLMYLLSQYYSIFSPIDTWDTNTVSIISNPCIKNADENGLIEFCDDTLCQNIKYNLTGSGKFVEIIGSNTFSKNYMGSPCGIVSPCGQELLEFFYTIPPGPLYTQLSSNPLNNINCDDPCYWALNGNDNVDDFYHFIGPTNVGEDFIIKTNRGQGNDERVRVKNAGGIDFKVGTWNDYHPQISFGSGSTQAPTIMLYRNTGNTANLDQVYPYWIQGTDGSNGGLKFMNQDVSGNYIANIGEEDPITRVMFKYNGNVGINQEDAKTRLHITNGNVQFNGNTTSTTDVLPTGAGTRFLWAAGKSAIRAGEVTGANWDNANIGSHSAAFGLDNLASGSFTLVAGRSNIITGNYSNGVGSSNTITSDYSFASGSSNTIIGDYSFAYGLSNTITGEYSFASGSSNSITSNYATAFGNQNKVTGLYAIAFGILNKVFGSGSFASGYNNILNGTNSLTVGNTISSYGSNAFTGGLNVENKGTNSIAFGQSASIHNYVSNCLAFGDGVHIYSDRSNGIGNNLKISGDKSMALGNNIQTLYEGSFAIGDNNGVALSLDDYLSTSEKNQILLRFEGDPAKETDHKTYRFVTETEVISDVQVEKNGVYLIRGGNSWSSLSDRNLKKNIEGIDKFSILENLRQIPIKSWQWRDGWTYKDTVKIWDDFSYTWLGPIAQDFHSKFGNYGSGDSTLLNSATMDAVMFASIQALADLLDTQQNTINDEKLKLDTVNNYSKELLTKSEFEEFKNNIDCLDSICERVSTLETNNLTKTEFNSFKDSISCYADACKRITELEEVIKKLNERLEKLENTDTTKEKGKIVFNYNEPEVILEQNNPNPFSDETKINYYIPSDFTGQAELIISNEKGSKILKKLDACIGKPCGVTISASGLSSGVYIYALLLDGKIIKSKKLMIIK